MEIKIAENIGFCWGVKRALDITFKALGSGKVKLCSLGRVIHNPQITDKLSESGLIVIKDIGDINDRKFLVRSHGISPQVIRELSLREIEIIDATCPFVKRTQDTIEKLIKEGYKIIIVGEKEHPEVQGLAGHAAEDATVINTADELSKYDFDNQKRWAVVAQSTQSQRNFQEVVSKLIERNFDELRIFFTICQETLKREKLTQDLANTCDLVLVVGGFDSANTRRLKEIALFSDTASYQIENAGQIEARWFENLRSVGIVSGTSTPEWVVDEVVKKISENISYGARRAT